MEKAQMSDHAMTTETRSADPLRSAADAMTLALQAAKDGAADAQQRVNEMMPAIGGFLSRLTYTTCYAVSYGVVFPTLLVARAVPKDNAIVNGLVDGARAARDSLDSRSQESASMAPAHEHPHIIVPGEEAAG
jgi:hypothetical protein